MNIRTIAKVVIISAGIWQAASGQSTKETNTPESNNDAITWRQYGELQYQETRAQMNDHEPMHAVPQSQTRPQKSTHATAKITVQSSEAKPYDQNSGPPLMEIRISETFTGDIDGESTVRSLQFQRPDKS